MSDFTEAMVGGLAAIYGRLGEAAVYEDEYGWCTECTVIQERDLSRFGNVAELGAKAVVFSVRRTEIDSRPKRGHTLTLTAAEEVYRVDSVILSDELEHRFLAA